MGETSRLRVLIANQRPDHLKRLAGVVTGLGHEVVASEVHVEDVGAETARLRPDLALVGLGENSDHALDLINGIVRTAFCPVIALLDAYDAAWVGQAARRGVYAYIVHSRPEELQSAIDIALHRFAEIQSLQGAFEARDAEMLRETQRTLARQHELLQLHDGVVQGLAAALLTLDLGHGEESHKILLQTLDNARALLSHSLDVLMTEGSSLEELIRITTPGAGQ